MCKFSHNMIRLRKYECPHHVFIITTLTKNQFRTEKENEKAQMKYQVCQTIILLANTTQSYL